MNEVLEDVDVLGLPTAAYPQVGTELGPLDIDDRCCGCREDVDLNRLCTMRPNKATLSRGTIFDCGKY